MPLTSQGESIPYDDQGNKTDPTGRSIDNFLRNLLGGEGVGGSPTPNLGILPQAPALGTPASGQGLGIQADPSYGVVGGGGLSPLQDYGTDAVPSPIPAPTPNVVPGSTVGGPGEFGPGVIGADVFEDPNALDPFGRFVESPGAEEEIDPNAGGAGVPPANQLTIRDVMAGRGGLTGSGVHIPVPGESLPASATTSMNPLLDYIKSIFASGQVDPTQGRRKRLR